MIEVERILVEIDSIIQYNGQPCGIILANSMALANYAASQVKITYKKIKGKEPLVTGNVLSVLDSIREQQEDQNDQEIEGSKIKNFQFLKNPFETELNSSYQKLIKIPFQILQLNQTKLYR